MNQDLYDKVLSELVGCEIQDKDELIKKISELTMMKKNMKSLAMLFQWQCLLDMEFHLPKPKIAN